MTHSTTLADNHKKTNKLKRIAIKAAVAALWLVLWQLVCIIVDMELLVVSPLTVLQRLIELAQTPEFWLYSAQSLVRITAGFALGSVVGIAMAIVCSRFTFAREFFAPAITIIKSTPVASFIILALVWLTGTYVPIFIGFLMVLPVIYSNVFQGIAEVDSKLLEMAQVFHMSRTKKITKIYIPSVLPYFMAACNTALGLAWKAGVAAEVIGVTKDSIGRQLYYSKIYIETADLFAWTTVVIILSLALEKIFMLCADKICTALHLSK